MPTIEIELSDGTTAVWFVSDEAADGAADMLTDRLGQPNSLKV